MAESLPNDPDGLGVARGRPKPNFHSHGLSGHSHGYAQRLSVAQKKHSQGRPMARIWLTITLRRLARRDRMRGRVAHHSQRISSVLTCPLSMAGPLLSE